MFDKMYSVYDLLSHSLQCRINTQRGWADEYGWVSSDQIEEIYSEIFNQIGILFSL